MRSRLPLFMRGLTWQLAAGAVAVSAGATLLITLLVNLVVSTQFEGYLRQNLQERVNGMAASLASTYRQGDGWTADVMTGLTHWTMMEDLQAQLVDSQGRLLWDSDKAVHDLRLLPLPGHVPGRRPEELPQRVQAPVMVGGNQVGLLVVRAAGVGGLFSAHDLQFRSTVNQWLAVAVVLVSGVSLLFSLVMAQNLTRPMVKLNRMAQLMRAGNWHLRVEPAGATEVAELAASLNALAETVERQEKLRRRLTSDVAHELRTPLANVRSHLQAMVDGVWDTTQPRLQACLDEVLRLVGLVGNLERLTEAEAASLRLTLEPVSLAEVASHTVEFFAALARERGIALSWRNAAEDQGVEDAGAGHAPAVQADRNHLQQVLANLVSNALKFTPSGGTVTVSVLRSDPQRREGGLAVSDTGPGIPEDEIPLIFERFYRGDRSRTRATGGTGLGLAIVQAFVRAMHGRMEVESQVGKGSTFTVWIPLADQGPVKPA
ncbi:MAG: ATP-binding protein [Bacillota bacterium]